MSSLIGRQIGGRYTLEKLIGEGGMAEVYLATQPKVNRKVAVKVLHRHLSADDQFSMRFEREAAAIANLKHPNIIQLYDFDRDDTLRQYFMVIEYINGPTLNSLMRHARGVLPLEQSLKIMHDLADALGYAHQRGMQHRDIKPSNIMIDEGERTVLMDFGIAKLVHESGQQLTASGAMVGTPAYISPEQASGIPGDHRSDIYSLGIVFFQLATGQLPYKGETPIATILKHIKEPPPQPTMLNPTLPLGIETVILRCIAKDADDRYQSTAELVAHLSDLETAGLELDDARTISGKILTDNFYSTPSRLATPANQSTPRPTPTSDLTDTLATAPRQTSLIIGAGAVAIIALLLLGAFLFSTAGNTEDATPIANPCILILEDTVFARPEPDESVTASIEFAGGAEIEVLRQSDAFWFIESGEAQGWVAERSLDVPADCQPS